MPDYITFQWMIACLALQPRV